MYIGEATDCINGIRKILGCIEITDDLFDPKDLDKAHHRIDKILSLLEDLET